MSKHRKLPAPEEVTLDEPEGMPSIYVRVERLERALLALAISATAEPAAHIDHLTSVAEILNVEPGGDFG